MLICLDRVNGSGCKARNPDNAKHCQKCGMSLRYALTLHNPDTIIGSYRICDVIGYGGFGAVYHAEDTRTGQAIALKETFNPDHTRAFQGEFSVLHRLNHDNLPLYYQMFEAQGNGYLVMELIPGQSLLEILQERQGSPLAESQVMGYAIQTCDALIYLHQQTPTLIHRDIKPANIRLTPHGLIKLVDFGLLKQGMDKTGSSRMGLTPAYAPLEQWGGTGLHTTPQSDIYSLGASLYHLLTGQTPLPVTDRISVTTDPLLPPKYFNPRLSDHVSTALMKALEIQPQNRFSNAAAFRQALVSAAPSSIYTTIGQETQQVEPTMVATPNSPQMAPNPYQPLSEPTQRMIESTQSTSLWNKPWFTALAAGILVLLVVGVLWMSGILDRRDDSQEQQANQTTITSTVDEPTAKGGSVGALDDDTFLSDDEEVEDDTAAVADDDAAAAVDDAAAVADDDAAADVDIAAADVDTNAPTTTPITETDLAQSAAQQPTSNVPTAVPMINSFFPVLMDEWRSEIARRGTECTNKGNHYWRYIPSKTYTVGGWLDDSDDDNDLEATVILPNYWIAKYPVTVQQYREFIEAGGYSNEQYWTPSGWDWRSAYNNRRGRTQPFYWDNEDFNSNNQPVVTIAWYEAVAYANWLNNELAGTLPAGYQIRLPTEAEWEVACAYDAEGQRFAYPWGQIALTRNFADFDDSNSSGYPAQVGEHSDGVGGCGVQNMVGSVWEAMSNSHASYPTGSTQQIQDFAVGSGDVPWRGGAWADKSSTDLRCGARGRFNPDVGDYVYGFRLVIAP